MWPKIRNTNFDLWFFRPKITNTNTNSNTITNINTKIPDTNVRSMIFPFKITNINTNTNSHYWDELNPSSKTYQKTQTKTLNPNWTFPQPFPAKPNKTTTTIQKKIQFNPKNKKNKKNKKQKEEEKKRKSHLFFFLLKWRNPSWTHSLCS